MRTFLDIISDREYLLTQLKDPYKLLGEYIDAIPDEVRSYIYGETLPSVEEFKIIYDYFTGLIELPPIVSSMLWKKIIPDDCKEQVETFYYDMSHTQKQVAEDHPFSTSGSMKYFKPLYKYPCLCWISFYDHDFIGFLGGLSSIRNTESSPNKRDNYLNFARISLRSYYECCKAYANKSYEDVHLFRIFNSRYNRCMFKLADSYGVPYSYKDANGEEHNVYYGTGKFTNNDWYSIEDNKYYSNLEVASNN